MEKKTLSCEIPGKSPAWVLIIRISRQQNIIRCVRDRLTPLADATETVVSAQWPTSGDTTGKRTLGAASQR